MENLNEIFVGILNKISKNPLQWDGEIGYYVASVKLSKKEENALDRYYEEFADFADNDFRGRGMDGNNASFYYEIDD